jgi:hypothetical protein
MTNSGFSGWNWRFYRRLKAPAAKIALNLIRNYSHRARLSLAGEGWSCRRDREIVSLRSSRHPCLNSLRLALAFAIPALLVLDAARRPPGPSGSSSDSSDARTVTGTVRCASACATSSIGSRSQTSALRVVWRSALWWLSFWRGSAIGFEPSIFSRSWGDGLVENLRAPFPNRVLALNEFFNSRGNPIAYRFSDLSYRRTDGSTPTVSCGLPYPDARRPRLQFERQMSNWNGGRDGGGGRAASSTSEAGIAKASARRSESRQGCRDERSETTSPVPPAVTALA